MLSGALYALLMDEIAKQIQNQNIGITLDHTNQKIGCLLWINDVALFHHDPTKLQKMLNITEQIATKYRIEFGEPKSTILIMGKTNKLNTSPKFTLGPLEIKQTDTYQYLGETLNTKANLTNHINNTKAKAEGALQTILTVAGDPLLRGIQMQTVWKLLDTCITPIITYASETWDLNKKETKQTNQIMDNIIKRILMIPTTTPREALYQELKILDMEHTMHKTKINMFKRLEKTRNSLIDNILKIENKSCWNNKTKNLIEHYNIDITKDKQSFKNDVIDKINKKFTEQLKKSTNTKTKINFLITNCTNENQKIRPAYLNKLNRKQCSTIFKARTRMLQVKTNFKTQT